MRLSDFMADEPKKKPELEEVSVEGRCDSCFAFADSTGYDRKQKRLHMICENGHSFEIEIEL
jgi:hypothetical protein